MNIGKVMKRLTPGPWQMVDPRHLGKCVRVEGIPLPWMSARPVICELWEPNWRANAHLIVAAPELLTALGLALAALEQPELAKAALQRGLAAISQVSGCEKIQADQAIATVLSEFGIIEPALSELALTTTPELAQAWVEYAQDQGLGTGFVVSQLRTGRQPPPDRSPKSWYTEAERRQFMIT